MEDSSPPQPEGGAAHLNLALTAHVTSSAEARRLRVLRLRRRGCRDCAASEVRGIVGGAILRCQRAGDWSRAWATDGGLESLQAMMGGGRGRSSSSSYFSGRLRVRRGEAIVELGLSRGLQLWLRLRLLRVLLVLLRLVVMDRGHWRTFRRWWRIAAG